MEGTKRTALEACNTTLHSPSAVGTCTVTGQAALIGQVLKAKAGKQHSRGTRLPAINKSLASMPSQSAIAEKLRHFAPETDRSW